MRRFKVTVWCRSYSTCIVEAKDEEEATELALSSDSWAWTHEGNDYEIDSIERIDVPPGEETTEVIDNFDAILCAKRVKEN